MKNDNRGFTLLELMITVIIVGVLAALAVPRFMNSSIRAKQAEAQGILKQIYTLETGYFQEHAVYTTDLNVLGVELLDNDRYSYSVVVTPATFLATADVPSPGLDNDAAPDTWTIDNTGRLICTSDDREL
jgi:prepilin-type N-terminal cleavage/methylation domain-containing protein